VLLSVSNGEEQSKRSVEGKFKFLISPGVFRVIRDIRRVSFGI